MSASGTHDDSYRSCPSSARGLHATLVWLRMGFDSPVGHQEFSEHWYMGIMLGCLPGETGSSPVCSATLAHGTRCSKPSLNAD